MSPNRVKVGENRVNMSSNRVKVPENRVNIMSTHSNLYREHIFLIFIHPLYSKLPKTA